MYESGCRLGELLSSRIKHIEFTSFGCNMTFPEGKTGSRTVPLVYSRSFIKQWLDCHPQKQDNNAYLLVSVYQNGDSFRKMTEHGLYVEIKKIARRAGIKKNVFPHLMRHSRASILAENLTDKQMKAYLGWSKNSQMCSVYIHDPQVENSVLKMYGISPVEEKQDNLKVIKCQQCKEYNPAINMHCYKCGSPLSEKAKRAEEEREKRVMEEAEAEIIKRVREEMKEALDKRMEDLDMRLANMIKAQSPEHPRRDIDKTEDERAEIGIRSKNPKQQSMILRKYTEDEDGNYRDEYGNYLPVVAKTED
jgi:integrase/recombinase XerD